MKIVDIRDGFIKIESESQVPLSSFLQIGDGIKQYIAQVIRSVSSAVVTTLYAKILFVHDGILKNYDGTKPDRKSPITSCTKEFIEQTLISNTPICVGDFIEDDINIFIDAKHFNKKMLVCFDDKEKFNGFVSNISEQFAKRKKVLIIDMQGIVTGNKFFAGKELKLPLNTKALDFMYNDCLLDATVDSKETIKDMFKELAEYSKTVDFLPFNTLKTIVDDMVNNKHVFKLLVFKNKLQKFAQIGCFAETKNEANSLANILNQGAATIDLSKLDSAFQNYYFENIYQELAKLNDDVQVFVNVSNSVSKKNLKNIISNESVSSTLIANSKFKYLDEIKTFFDNFIVEPSMAINNIFNIYSNYLKAMDSTKYLVVGEGTSYIPFVCKVNNDVFEIEESINEVRQEVESDEQETVEEQDIIEEKNIDENANNITDITEEVNEDKEIESAEAPDNAKNTEVLDDVENVENVAESEAIVITEPESDEPQISQDDINDIIDSKTENYANNENISITVGSETFDMFIGDEPEKESDVESLSSTDLQIDNATVDSIDDKSEDDSANITENIEGEEVLNFVENEENSETIDVSEDLNTEFVNQEDIEIAQTVEETDDIDFVEQQDDFTESVESEQKIDFVAENDYGEAEISDIKLDDLGKEYNTYDEVSSQPDESEIITLDAGEEVNLDSDILIELDNEIPELDEEALDKEIVDDVDKVFTTVKDDSISMDDLDFIDELNNDSTSQNEVLEIGDLEEELGSELQEYGGELLEQGEENDLASEEFVQERLETKTQTTPSVPVYNAEIPQEDIVKSDTLEQGDMVSHATYGNGIVEKKCKYGSKDLLLINFDNVGRRALDPTLTELKKI